MLVGLCGAWGLVTVPGDRRAAAAALVVALAAWPCLRSALRSRAPLVFLTGDLLLVAAVGLAQEQLGGRPATGWIFAVVSIMSVACYFEWPDRPVAAYLIASTGIGVYTVGSLLAGTGVPLVDLARLAVPSVLGWGGLLLVRRTARMADEMIAAAAERRVAAEAARARRAADRAYLAMLHDTASTTFLMVSTQVGDDVGWVPEQARRDLEQLSAPVPGDRRMELCGLLRSLSGYRGLRVRLNAPGRLEVPASQALAVYHGVREGLANIRMHTRDDSPSLSVHRAGDSVVVRLTDHGAGFRADQATPHRRGVSESIRARMDSVGGCTEIKSGPDRGTTVEWRWAG